MLLTTHFRVADVKISPFGTQSACHFGISTIRIIRPPPLTLWDQNEIIEINEVMVPKWLETCTCVIWKMI